MVRGGAEGGLLRCGEECVAGVLEGGDGSSGSGSSGGAEERHA